MAKILIVEDSPDLIEMYKIIFKLKKFDTEIASTKEVVLSQLSLNRPDLILMDVMLRGEDGRDICKELKQGEFKDIPIILISASPNKLEAYKDYQADDRLVKPFDLDALFEKIDSLLVNQKISG